MHAFYNIIYCVNIALLKLLFLNVILIFVLEYMSHRIYTHLFPGSILCCLKDLW